jgi:hypothetical protein
MLLVAVLSEEFGHGVGCCFNSRWQRGGELVLPSSVDNLLLRFGGHHLANQAAKALSDANGSHAWAFVQGN